MALPLPFKITEPLDGEAIQGNFDALAKQFPLSRKDLKIETPHVVGSSADEPAFQNSWVNFDTTVYIGLRFWKDPMGLVHIEGTVKNGAASPSTIFVLPVGYRPGAPGLQFSTISNTTAARVDITSTGNVVWQGGGTNAQVTLTLPPFKQEG